MRVSRLLRRLRWWLLWPRLHSEAMADEALAWLREHGTV